MHARRRAPILYLQFHDGSWLVRYSSFARTLRPIDVRADAPSGGPSPVNVNGDASTPPLPGPRRPASATRPPLQYLELIVQARACDEGEWGGVGGGGSRVAESGFGCRPQARSTEQSVGWAGGWDVEGGRMRVGMREGDACKRATAMRARVQCAGDNWLCAAAVASARHECSSPTLIINAHHSGGARAEARVRMCDAGAGVGLACVRDGRRHRRR